MSDLQSQLTNLNKKNDELENNIQKIREEQNKLEQKIRIEQNNIANQIEYTKKLINEQQKNSTIKSFINDLEKNSKEMVNNDTKQKYTLLLEEHLANLICDKNNNNISLLNQLIREYKLQIDKERMYENLYYAQCRKARENFDGCILFADYKDSIRNDMWSKYSHLFESK